MVPDIAVMIFALGVPALLSIITRREGAPTPFWVKNLAAIGLIVAAFMLWDVFVQSNAASKAIQDTQQALQGLKQ